MIENVGYGDSLKYVVLLVLLPRIQVEQLILVSEKPVSVEGVILARPEGSDKEDAQFKVFASGNSDSEIEVISLDRLDRYGKNGNCAAKQFRPFCDCY